VIFLDRDEHETEVIARKIAVGIPCGDTGKTRTVTDIRGHTSNHTKGRIPTEHKQTITTTQAITIRTPKEYHSNQAGSVLRRRWQESDTADVKAFVFSCSLSFTSIRSKC
jgi:hypothetical protein